MGWPTKYKGPQIDEALEKGRNLRVVNNGWIRLDSSAASPTALGDLKNPGNYITAYWTDGPNFGDTSITPLNINIILINGDTYQFVDAAGTKYCRIMKNGESTYGAWEIDQTIGATNPGPNPPSSPIDRKTMWLDISNPNAPTLKLYVDGEWKEIIPEEVMQATVYDPQGRKTDIFKYIDDAITEATLGDSGIDFKTHIEDTTIHVTAEEREKWNAAATMEDVNNAASALQASLESKVTEAVNSDIGKVNALTTTANALKNEIESHTGNSEIHPSAEKQAEWNNKASVEHTHNLDGKVTIDAAHIVGDIPTEKLPYDVKERVYSAENEDAVYAMQKNPLHNGDIIYVEDSKGDTWYFVINDEYLGNTQVEGWTEGTISDTSRAWYSVCYGKDKFVAVAQFSNVFAYSTDGINWTEGTISNTERGWMSVCYGNGKFVAIACNSDVFAYSTDGITWTEGTISSTGIGWNSVCYGNGKFIAVAQSSIIFVYSTDGITWTVGVISDTNRIWMSVCYGNGKFVAVAAISNVFAYSTDGITWTEGTISSTIRYWYSICYGNGKFVAVASSSTIFAYSTDGITWTEGTISDTSRGWTSVCYGGGKFVTVAVGNNFAYSTDGINWIEGTISDTSSEWYSVCYGNGKYVAIVFRPNVFAYSTLDPLAPRAFKKFSTKSEVSWSDIKNTPTSLSGYGITNAASKEDLNTVRAEVEDISIDVDLSGTASANALYATALNNLEMMDTTFDFLEGAIAALEEISR